MTHPLPPGAVIGIVGGGQLGRMSAQAAARLGYRTRILTNDPDSPAAQVTSLVTLADLEDTDALARFAEAVDVVTFEFENVSAAALDVLAARCPVHPSPAILRLTQDRMTEKSFVNGAGAPTGTWMPVRDRDELEAAAGYIGFPCVLKTTRGGYDGRGQAVLHGLDDLLPAITHLSPAPFILEGLVDLACELSVVVVRGQDGTVAAFDPVENRHADGILDVTLAPARVAPPVAETARDIAIDLARCLDLVGVLAAEFFLDAHGTLLVNELAPRPHNSGHWTIDACPASQFEMHVRAVAGLPLPRAVRHSDAVMKNLLGPPTRWPAVLAAPGLIPHLYGKREAAPGRKMGHVTRLFPRGALPGEHGVRAALEALS